MRLQMAGLGQVEEVFVVHYAVALGTTVLSTAVLRLASIMIGRGATTSTTVLVFGLFVLWGGLCSPLYSYPFTLCSSYSFHFYSVTEWSDQRFFSDLGIVDELSIHDTENLEFSQVNNSIE